MVLAIMFVIGACSSKPATSVEVKVSDQVMPPDVLEHKGTALGMATPRWIEAYIENGSQGVEKLPEYKDRYVIVLESEGQNRQGAQLAMDVMDVNSQISRMFTTRVEQKFAGAQVGDRDMLEEYFENVVKLVSTAAFTGLEAGSDYWVYLQYYKPGAKTKADVERRVYRVFRVYSIDRNLLQVQLDKYLKDAEGAIAKTPEKERAIDLVHSSFYDDF